MPEIQRFHFHTMRNLKASQGKNTEVAYRLATFQPERDVKIIGATLGLLTCSIDDHLKGCVELYVAVTYNQARPSRYRNWVQYKRDFLFYSQRDVYTEPTASNDLVVNNWLPVGHYFAAGPRRPVNVYAGALNSLPWDTLYDVFGCIYYTED
jgi:hypothetical protein